MSRGLALSWMGHRRMSTMTDEDVEVREMYDNLLTAMEGHPMELAVQAIGAAVSKLFGLIKDDRIRMAAAKSFGEIVVMLAADPAVCSGRAPNGERYQ